ncbi:hypothetical protein M977_04311 [Buttiauxella gaviniae ATCC 51604]|uniref:Uncharacterized protein n=2 Tax=Buttiauxella gaviniae TaxID=82990 RepID=A0A1B7HN50_9ENTR|nr:hypothetical protein M977_04311 [Buttiauxella gaviniae ATCC 51604]
MLNFNTNLFPRPYIDECTGYYSIKDKTAELQPVTYWGGDFDELKDSLKKVKLYTGAMRKRIKTVSDKVSEMMLPGEKICYVFHQSNNVMTKPAIIICMQSQSGEKRVICSSVKAVIESDHHAFGDRCDFYVGEWSNETSKNGKSYVWVNMSKRISEKPVSFRGKPKAAPEAQPVATVITTIDDLMQDYAPEDFDHEAPPAPYAYWLEDEPEEEPMFVKISDNVYQFNKSFKRRIHEHNMKQQQYKPEPDPVVQAMLAGMKKKPVHMGLTDEERKERDRENLRIVDFYAREHDYYQRQRYAA